MLFDFETDGADSPFVERIWKTHNERVGAFTSLATSHWEMVVMRHEGELTLTVRGPETHATFTDCSIYGEWFGIIFKFGTVMPKLPASKLVNGSLDLPNATSTSFWLDGAVWEYPDFENADTFVARLVRQGLLVCDPIVDESLRNHPHDLSPRSVQRHFLRATGLTRSAICQIERARLATSLLQEGLSILDVVEQAGYADQPHLTRALKRFIGKTPAQLVEKSSQERMSLLLRQLPGVEIPYETDSIRKSADRFSPAKGMETIATQNNGQGAGACEK